MNVALKLVLLAQQTRDLHEPLHRVVRGPDDPRAEKQPFDVVTPIEGQRQGNHLGHSETRPRHIAGAPVHAIETVVDAEIGEEDLQQRNAAAIGREAMADTHARRGADPTPRRRVALRGATAGTRGVVLRCIRQKGELAFQFHAVRIYSIDLSRKTRRGLDSQSVVFPRVSGRKNSPTTNVPSATMMGYQSP